MFPRNENRNEGTIVHAIYTYYSPPEYFSVSCRRAISNYFAPEFSRHAPVTKKLYIDPVCLYSPLGNSACKGTPANPQSYSCMLKSFARILWRASVANPLLWIHGRDLPFNSACVLYRSGTYAQINFPNIFSAPLQQYMPKLIPQTFLPGMYRFCGRWYIRMFSRNESRNEGTFACSPGTKTGTKVHSPKPPLYETALLSPSDLWWLCQVFLNFLFLCVCVFAHSIFGEVLSGT